MQTNAVQMRNTSLSCKFSWRPLQYRKYNAEHSRCNSSEQAQARYLATITIRLPGQELHRRQHHCRTRRGGVEEHFQQRLAHRLGLDSSNALTQRWGLNSNLLVPHPIQLLEYQMVRALCRFDINLVQAMVHIWAHDSSVLHIQFFYHWICH